MPKLKASQKQIDKMINYKISGLTNEEIGRLVNMNSAYVGVILANNMENYNEYLPSNTYKIENLQEFAIVVWEGNCKSDKYITQKDKYLWVCKYEHEFTADWYMVREREFWCPECKKLKRIARLLKMEDRRDTLKQLMDDGIDFKKYGGERLGEYIIDTLLIKNDNAKRIIMTVSLLFYRKMYYRSFGLDALAASLIHLITNAPKGAIANHLNISDKQLSKVERLLTDKEKKVMHKVKTKMREFFDWNKFKLQILKHL